jgi:Adenylosuccinate synthetase (EC 6.3.4.4)
MFTVLTGAQFGDEGKGKIVDFLSKDADIIVRFQGGDNAGHTVAVDDDVFKLHLIPSGVIYGKRLLIGPGVVMNPIFLKAEIEGLKEEGIDVGPKMLGIDAKTSIIMPYHIEMDRLTEERNKDKIGTTKRGIGFAYADKISRDEVRLIDIIDEERFFKIYEDIAPLKEGVVELLGGDPAIVRDREKIAAYIEVGKFLKEFIVDVSYEVNNALNRGKNVLAEGAQGTFLDVIHGTQRWVTSSNTIAGAASSYLGVGPKRIDEVYGITKAYITRVGEGPLPTEINGRLGDELRERGNEYGTTTKRPRRCGWFDGVLFRKALNLNGYTKIALTKLDSLAGMGPLKICTSYKLGGKILEYPPDDTYDLIRCKPIYEDLDGWDEDLDGYSTFDDFPKVVRDYVRRIEEIGKTKINLISVGKKRDQLVIKSG